MRRRKRMLFVLAPLLVGLGFYNFMFFRDRAGKLSGPPAAAPIGKTAQTAPPVVEGVTSTADKKVATAGTPLPPRSYQEGITRLAPRALASALSLPASWAVRDVFTHRSAAAASANGDAAAAALNGTVPAQAGDLASPEKIPVPLRVDGWLRTPEGEYAIVNGSLAKDGMRLPTDERILTVTRGGVVVSTGQGIQVLPLDGEVADARLQKTVRSMR